MTPDESEAASPHQRRVERALGSIMDALQGTPLPLGIDLRPIAERVYRRAGRDVMEAWESEMREAQR